MELEKFEEWVHGHVYRFFPKEYKAAGEPLIRELIRDGRTRAAAYGFTDKREACQYIDLMVILGRDFDTDAGLPWAGAILRKAGDAGARMQFLCQVATDHVGRRKA